MSKKQAKKPAPKPLPEDKTPKGRPAQYNDPDYLDPFFDALSTGVSIQAACDVANLDRSTVRKWAQKAREGVPEYQLFFLGYKRARSCHEISNVRKITKAAETQWQAAAWLLERTCPVRYGRKNNVSFNGDAVIKNGTIAPEQFVKMLNTEQLAQLIAAIEQKTTELEQAKELPSAEA